MEHEFLKVYLDCGGPGGPLGFPLEDRLRGNRLENLSGVSQEYGEWQPFEGGTIASLQNRTYAVWGRVHRKWQAAGGVGGEVRLSRAAEAVRMLGHSWCDNLIGKVRIYPLKVFRVKGYHQVSLRAHSGVQDQRVIYRSANDAPCGQVL